MDAKNDTEVVKQSMSSAISGFVGIGFCSVCEIAQLFDSVPGTFDHIDLIVENLAVIFSILTSLYIWRLHYEKGS